MFITEDKDLSEFICHEICLNQIHIERLNLSFFLLSLSGLAWSTDEIKLMVTQCQPEETRHHSQRSVPN